MTDPTPPEGPHRTFAVSRRGFLGAVGGMAAGAAVTGAGIDLASRGATAAALSDLDSVERFFGVHQGGITTFPQSHTCFAILDVTTERRQELAELMRSWTSIASKLASGKSVAPFSGENKVEADSGEAIGLGPARLTINFGFGPSLFCVDGADRFGLADQQPMQLVPLPAFPGDHFVEATTGGDLSINACADDPQVAFHAVRQLVRAAGGAASLRWAQAGFNEAAAATGTPRNLMGFKDGTVNPRTEGELSSYVWVGEEGPAWMKGGSYLVVRRIRIDLDGWDAKPLGDQERVIGRHKLSGAPLGTTEEFAPLDLDATNDLGDPVIPLDAHVRLASPQHNWGQMMLRRSYAYDNGADASTETSAGSSCPAFDAGLLFVCYQRAPRFAFIPIFRNLARQDALTRYTTHTASAIVAVPPAAPHQGRWVGQRLLEV